MVDAAVLMRMFDPDTTIGFVAIFAAISAVIVINAIHQFRKANDDVARSEFKNRQAQQQDSTNLSVVADDQDEVDSGASNLEDDDLKNAVERTRQLSERARVQDARARVTRIMEANRRRQKSDQ